VLISVHKRSDIRSGFFLLSNLPLKFYINIPFVYHSLPIHSLKIIATEFHIKSTSRIINSLNDNGYYTIGHVLNASLDDLAKTRNLAERGQSIILTLLQRLSVQPDLLMKHEDLERIVLLDEERINRIEAIMKRLREMGLIK